MNKWERAAWQEMQPQGIVVLATVGPISLALWDRTTGDCVAALGSNRRAWPARVGYTTTWPDTVTQQWNKLPMGRVEIKLRLWVPDAGGRMSMMFRIEDRLRALQAEVHGDVRPPLNRGWYDIGDQFDWSIFAADVFDDGRRARLAPADDDAQWRDVVHRGREIRRRGLV